jgi:DNA polymerase-1
LASIIGNFFPEFQDYKKSMVAGYEGNLATMPLEQLVLYNCADCDVTKRAEVLTAPNVSEALVKVYIHTARTIDAMEKRGPWLDSKALARVKDALPGMIGPLESKLRHLAGDPELNPKSQIQLADLLYDKLGLPDVSKKKGERRNTNEGALRIIEQQTKSPVPRIILNLRALYNIEGTFIKGYERSAAVNNGQLRTTWWLTGAVTGRLRSGRGAEQEAKGIVNFQNLHGNPIMQSMLVSDPDWRLALEDR